MDRETAIAHFRRLGAKCGKRQRSDVGEVIGIQLRGFSVKNEDLQMLQYLAEDVDVIGLENTGVTDEGLRHLCHLRKLDNIDLANTDISDSGLKVLTCIDTLECLCVEGTRVTERGIRDFEKALPECYVTWDGRPI